MSLYINTTWSILSSPCKYLSVAILLWSWFYVLLYSLFVYLPSCFSVSLPLLRVSLSCSVSTTQATPINPCDPSPCGPNSQCRIVGDTAACTCLPNYIGRPPSCRPECIIHAECASNLACVSERCVDPCIGACGSGAACRVINHNAVCTCPPGYTGDATAVCRPLPTSKYFGEVSTIEGKSTVLFLTS